MWRSFIYKCEFIKVKDMMTLEDMNKTMVYVVPAFNDDWLSMLDVEKMSLTELADIVNRSYEFPLLYNVEERHERWFVTQRITQQKYNYIEEFDTEEEAIDYMYGSCLYGKVLVWDYFWDYYEDVNHVYQVLADMLEISTETVVSLVKWNEKRKIARLNRNFRYDYAHYRRVIRSEHPRNGELKRLMSRLSTDLKYGCEFTQGWKNHFGEEIQGKMVEDVIEMIKERKY